LVKRLSFTTARVAERRSFAIMARSVDPIAAQTGFGFAAYLIMITLLDKLADRDVITREDVKEILDHALLNAETHQTGAPFPQMVETVVVARKAIEGVLTISEAKRTQTLARRPKE
jgi:hypothetical protein